MAKLAFENGDRIYVYSNRTSKYSDRWKKMLPRNPSMIQPQLFNERMSQVIELPGGIRDFVEQEKVLSVLIQNITDTLNKAVQEDSKLVAASRSQQDLVNLKREFAQKAAVKYGYRNKQSAHQVIDDFIGSMAQVYSALYNADEATLVYAITHSPDFAAIAKTPLGRHISSLPQKLNGKCIDYNHLQENVNALVTTLKNSGVGAGSNKANIQSIRAGLNGAVGQYSAEEMAGYLLAQTVEKSFSDVAKGAVGKYHTGQFDVTVTAPSANDLARADTMRIRTDTSSDWVNLTTELDGQQQTIRIELNATDKWYQTIQYGGQDYGIGRWKTEKDGKGVFTPTDIKLLNEGSVARYIDEIAKSISARAGYVNAYAHAQLGNPEDELFAPVERWAAISGLSGTGQQFYKNGVSGAMGTDVNSLLILNGQFYSVYNIVMNILKASTGWRKNFSISYDGGKDAITKENWWRDSEGDAPNWDKAMRRSADVLDRLRRFKISVTINPKKLMALASHPIS